MIELNINEQQIGIERETRMPVIGADIALYWRALQRLGLRPRTNGFGKLIDSLAN